jgi:hypothetical protein
MKRITFRADSDLIELARQAAKSEHKTLNILFREWLREYTTPPSDMDPHEALMKRLRQSEAEGPNSHDGIKER